MKRNRNLYAAVGVLILLLAGLIYAWSVLSLPLGAFFTEWTKAQLSLTFTICMMAFCFGCMFGGMAAKKLPVKFMVWISAALFLAGFGIASRANSPAVLYLGYGVLCGFASGFVYNAVLSTVGAWFPDKQGLMSGILLMGFGMSSFLVGKVYQAATPSGEGIEAWRTSFFVFGVILFLVLGICGLFLERPEKKELEKLGISAAGKKNVSADGLDIDWKQMIQRPSFWIFLIWTICIGGAGMAMMGQASGIAKEVGTGADAGTIATVVGLISIFNGLGRIFFGNLFDKKGRRFTMITVGAAYAMSSLILVAALVSKAFFLIIVGFICCGFSYGGLNPSISAYVNSAYGARNYAMNFSVMNLNLLIASMGGTIGGMLYDASGSYLTTLFYMVGSGLVSLIFAMMLRKL